VTTVLVTHDQEEAMEVSSRIVVMNHARVEQVGAPADLYERPASDFVMGFVGKVNRLPGAYIRPHEVRICDPREPGCEAAEVERLLALGFETRVELRRRRDGQRLWAQLAPDELARLGLEPGQEVGIDLARARRSATRRSSPAPRHSGQEESVATLSAPVRVALVVLVFALFALLGRAVAVGLEGVADALVAPAPARQTPLAEPGVPPGDPPTVALTFDG
jgi:hypothetical protein